MSTVLLTGATGFVGRHIHKHLITNGHDVRVVLRTGSGSRLSMPMSSGKIVETPDLFVENQDWWARVCEDVDVVIHSAWYVEPGLYLDSPENAICVAGSLELARGATKAGVKHFVGIGTCMEYRLPSGHLHAGSPVGPSNFYSICKLGLYQMLREWHGLHGALFSWCRLFYLFGEGEHPNRLVPYLRRSLAAGEIAELSSGEQLRDFLDVADAGAMIANVIDTRQVGVINICSGKQTTIRAFVEGIAREYGRPDLLAFGARAVQAVDPQSVVGHCNAIQKRN